MKIAMVGTGYVGLVSGTCFAEMGTEVTCVDIDTQKIEGLKNGKVPIFEPGLDELVAKNVREGRLYFSTSLAESLDGVSLVFSAVGTPPDEDGSLRTGRGTYGRPTRNRLFCIGHQIDRTRGHGTQGAGSDPRGVG